ncbi:MAG: acetate/propionate family kinase [Ruminococcaceae bacterium]|nr:acetate/propionate family kinase [Oscillospiraceae bacterium]
MKILVCNVGSTSLKFKLFDMPGDKVLAEGKVERVGRTDAIFHYGNCSTGYSVKLEEQNIPSYAEGILQYLGYLTHPEYGVIADVSEIERVGFKTVLAKGFYGIHELTEEVLQAMRDYLVVAPAHNGPYLEAIGQIRQVLPGVMLVGVFETAFHTTIPKAERIYGIPYEWHEKYGIQKMGYHGASHGYVADVLTERNGGTGNAISCHLGGSGSLCAIQNGISLNNSFGFSLQAGPIHANRIGDTDAYVIPYLLSQGMSIEDITKGMDKQGGLLGISGVSNDLRDVQLAAEAGNERAQLAIDVYCAGIVHYVGAYYAQLGGLDHLAFTGGIGENSDLVRKTVCRAVAHFGIVLDEEKNAARVDQIRVISAPDSRVKVWVIPANEELGIARRTYEYR